GSPYLLPPRRSLSQADGTHNSLSQPHTLVTIVLSLYYLANKPITLAHSHGKREQESMRQNTCKPEETWHGATSTTARQNRDSQWAEAPLSRLGCPGQSASGTTPRAARACACLGRLRGRGV